MAHHAYRYYEQRANEFPTSKDDRVVGLGLGQLSAAAVACSTTLVDFISLAADAVRLAFRTGAVVDTMSQQCKTEHGSEGSWSLLIARPPDAVEAELEDVQDRLVCYESHHLLILG